MTEIAEEQDITSGLDGIKFEYDSTLRINNIEYSLKNGNFDDDDIHKLLNDFKYRSKKFDMFKIMTNILPRPARDKKRVRNLIGQRKWKELRQNLYEDSEHKCDICDKNIGNDRFYLGDSWRYNFDERKIVLQGLYITCGLCNIGRNVGAGFVVDDEKKKDVEEHFLKVNQCNIDEYNEYKKYVADLNVFILTTNIDWQMDYGIYNDIIKQKIIDIDNKKKSKKPMSIFRKKR